MKRENYKEAGTLLRALEDVEQAIAQVEEMEADDISITSAGNWVKVLNQETGQQFLDTLKEDLQAQKLRLEKRIDEL